MLEANRCLRQVCALGGCQGYGSLFYILSVDHYVVSVGLIVFLTLAFCFVLHKSWCKTDRLV